MGPNVEEEEMVLDKRNHSSIMTGGVLEKVI